MKTFAILEPFFHALNDGKLIRLTVAWVLRVLAVLVALVGVFGFIFFLRIGFNSGENGPGTRSGGILIGCFLFALFGLAWGYASAGILALRANSVLELGDSHFTVLSILSLLFRLNGELSFVFYSLLGVGGCLFMWLTDFSPLSTLGMLGERIPFGESMGNGFLGGIEFAVLMLLIAFASIVFLYALAELTVVSVEIALNTRGLRNPAAVNGPAPSLPGAPRLAPPAAPVPAVQPAASTPRRCSQCGNSLEAGSLFCGECGTQAG